MQKINLQEPQRNRNANANFVNLIRTSTVATMYIVIVAWNAVFRQFFVK